MTERENDPAQGAPELPPLPRYGFSINKAEHGMTWAVTPDPAGRLCLYSEVSAYLTAYRQARQAAPEALRGPASAVSPDVAGMLQQCIDALMECDRDGDYPLIENIREAVSLFAIDRLAASEAEAVKVEAVEKCCVNCLHYTKGADEWPCRGCGIESSDGPFDHWEPLRATPSKLPENAREWTDSESAAFRQGWAFGRTEGLRAAIAASPSSAGGA